MSEDFKSRAKKWPKGNHYEDFELGHVYHHHWGRTLNDGDNSLFSTLTLSFNPLYFNAEYAAAHGHGGVVLNPMLVFLTVFGLSVEDLSEAGGLFLGVDDLKFHRTVYPGETLSARKQHNYLGREQVLFEALCELWPAKERRERLRLVAMAAMCVVRLATEAWLERGGRRPLSK